MYVSYLHVCKRYGSCLDAIHTGHAQLICNEHNNKRLANPQEGRSKCHPELLAREVVARQLRMEVADEGTGHNSNRKHVPYTVLKARPGTKTPEVVRRGRHWKETLA